MTTAANMGGVIPVLTATQRLVIAREHAGLSQGDLAKELDVSLATIYRAEAGKISRRTLLSWAMATGVNLQWLETGKAPADPEGPDGGDEVRHQGLEPRTRWFEASAGQGRGNVLPLRQPVHHPERHVAMKAAS